MNMKIIAPSSANSQNVSVPGWIASPRDDQAGHRVAASGGAPSTLSIKNFNACGMNRSKLRARKMVTRTPTSESVYGR